MRKCLILTSAYIATVSVQAQAKTAEVSVGTRYTSFYYKEILTAPAKSTETVTYPSLLLAGRVFFAARSYFQLSYEDTKNVKSRYDGAALVGGAPQTGSNPLSFNTVEASVYFKVTEAFSFYTGYAMHKWDRFLTGGAGYREIYTWNYLSIGMQYWFISEPTFEFAMDVSMRQPSAGKIKVITSETVSGGDDSQMKLGAKPGYRLSLPLIWRSENLSFTLAPFYEISKIGESNVVTNTTLAPTLGSGIQEPSSETTQYGLEIAAAIGF